MPLNPCSSASGASLCQLRHTGDTEGGVTMDDHVMHCKKCNAIVKNGSAYPHAKKHGVTIWTERILEANFAFYTIDRRG